MEATPESIKQVIEKYLNSEITDHKTNFFTQGILDSFDAINLLFELENQFDIKLEVMEFTNNDNFRMEFLIEKIKSLKQ
jgi:D-alanine--poly(phosphoribitol) ligase subunit 2